MVVEDLHWIDRSSEEFLSTLVDSLAGAPIFLLCSWRPGYRAPWADHSYVTQVALRPLSPRDSLSVVSSIVQPEQITAPLANRILERAEGNPFFLEELCRAVVEHRDLGGAERLPDTIQGVLAARVDRLPETPRRVLQSASAIGREFSLRLLRAIWDEPNLLAAALQELERREFVYVQSAAPEQALVFKHALTQEAAYASLTSSRRRQLHQRIARALMDEFPDVSDSQPELLAHHFTEAGLGETAIGFWQRAGDRAAERSANVEAISHFREALDLLAKVPESPERAPRELALQIALGGPLIATHGYGAPETVAAYARARELAEQVSEPAQLFPLLYRKWVTYTIWSQQQEARAAAEEFLSLAEQQPDSAPRMMGHRILGLTLFFLGEFAASRAEFGRALALYDADRHRALAHRYGQEPRAAILAWLSVSLWLTGHAEEAMRMSDEAIAAATESGHVNTQAYVLVYGRCLLETLRGDGMALERYLRTAIDLADEHQLAMWRAYATTFEGWMIGARGDHARAITRMREGLDNLRAIGAEALRPHVLGLLASLYIEAGQTELALGTLAEAIDQVATSAERWCEAELHRLRGEVLRRHPGADAERIQACFQRALAIVQAQGAVALERRLARPQGSDHRPRHERGNASR
jgi:predicted ATPase